MNHVATADSAVPFAQFLIPGSGPGGKIGYMDHGAKNIRTESFGHSSCLTESALSNQLIDEGTWDRFLRQPRNEFTDPTQFNIQSWTPFNPLARAMTRVMGILIFIILAVPSALRRIVDR